MVLTMQPTTISNQQPLTLNNMAQQYIITAASRQDAPAIAEAIMMALGDDLCASIARGKEYIPLLRTLFTDFAASEDNQYSYRNTLVAREYATGKVVGALVAYDGANIAAWRAKFFGEANTRLGQSFSDDLPYETSAGEIYLDSLAVFPEHRGCHLARRLIEAMVERHKDGGIPLGLLVEYHKDRAQALYRSCGFTDAGEVSFIDTPMLHMVHNH